MLAVKTYSTDATAAGPVYEIVAADADTEVIRRSPKKQKNLRLSRLGNGMRIAIFSSVKSRKQAIDKALIPRGTPGAVFVVDPTRLTNVGTSMCTRATQPACCIDRLPRRVVPVLAKVCIRGRTDLRELVFVAT